MRGLFIAFEGLDGCGKTTTLKHVAKRAAAAGHSVLMTHEPQEDSAIGRQIYDILYRKETNPVLRLERLSKYDLQRLFVMDRYQHVRSMIIPALEEGRMVLCDRYWFSTLAYGMLSESVESLVELHHRIFEGKMLVPNLAFLIDVSAEEAMRRRGGVTGKALDDFEKIEKQKHVRENYRKVFAAGLAPGEILDGMKTPDEIADAAWRHISRLI